MKIALVHDWLISPIGGGEKVLQAIHELFPAPIFTLIQDREKLKNSYFENLPITSSFIQKLPFAKKLYQNYLPLFPTAIERFDLSSFDLILSSSHCVAKGVKKNPNQLHICYCHTPMRYAWDLMDAYLEQAHLSQGISKVLAKRLLLRLQKWDLQSCSRVDHFVANSKYIAKRIERCYGVSSHVIYPPVDTEFFTLEEKKEDFYVTASRLAQNKRIDLITAAFRNLPHKKLFIIGDGKERESLQKTAPPNVVFLGELPKETLKTYLQKAKAFLFAAIEDFGIAPVEALAAGTPVIALGVGGVLETVIPNKTGIFYPEQTPSSLEKAILSFESLVFDPVACHIQASKFSKTRFQEGFKKFVLEHRESRNGVAL